APLALDRELDRQARLAHLRDQLRQIAETGLGRERILLVASKHPDEPAHLGQRAAPDRFDRLAHLARPGLLVSQPPPLPTPPLPPRPPAPPSSRRCGRLRHAARARSAPAPRLRPRARRRRARAPPGPDAARGRPAHGG